MCSTAARSRSHQRIETLFSERILIIAVAQLPPPITAIDVIFGILVPSFVAQTCEKTLSFAQLSPTFYLLLAAAALSTSRLFGTEFFTDSISDVSYRTDKKHPNQDGFKHGVIVISFGKNDINNFRKKRLFA